MRWLSTLLSFLSRAETTDSHTEEPDIEEHEDDVPPEPEPEGPITTVGAWAGSSSLSNPTRDVAAMVAAGVNRLDIIVNDHSVWRKPQAFTIRNRERLIRLADECHRNGIEVHLMSWLMPHEAYIRRAAEVLIPLMADMGAKSLVWDAEEPWTLAKTGMGYKEAAALVGKLFEGRDFEMGVTGIRYASKSKLGPLIAVSDYAVPQCYSTSSSKADPSTVVSKGVKQWRDRFGDKVRIVPALASYRQTEIKGHSAASAMQAAIDDAKAYGPTVIYWSASAIRKSNVITKAVAGIRS